MTDPTPNAPAAVLPSAERLEELALACDSALPDAPYNEQHLDDAAALLRSIPTLAQPRAIVAAIGWPGETPPQPARVRANEGD